MLPLFLDIDRSLRTHMSLVERYGGMPGMRDIGLLHSAIAMPQASYEGEFLHKDLFEMAAPISSTSFRTTRLWTATSVREPRRPSFSWT